MTDIESIYQMRFPQKLWYLIGSNPAAIQWSASGRTILLNYKVLDAYLGTRSSVFKTKNLSSFIRQLNLYGFRKVTSHLQDPVCNSSNPHINEYSHFYFQYGRPELLNDITRKCFNLKKKIKPKNNADEFCSVSRLQRARKKFRMTLRKAVQEVFMVDTKCGRVSSICNTRDANNSLDRKDIVIDLSGKCDKYLSESEQSDDENDFLIDPINKPGNIVGEFEKVPFKSNEHVIVIKNESDRGFIMDMPNDKLHENHLKNITNQKQVLNVDQLLNNITKSVDTSPRTWELVLKEIDDLNDNNANQGFKEIYQQISKSVDLLNE